MSNTRTINGIVRSRFFSGKIFFFTVLLAFTQQLAIAANPDSIAIDSVAITSFENVYASSSVTVVLVNNLSQFIYMEGTAAAIASVKVKQQGTTIYISRKSFSHNEKVLVYVPALRLRSIEADDGARVCSYDPVKGDTLLLLASNQSSIRITSDANVVRSSSSSNGEIQLFETCNYSFAQTDDNGVSFIELRKKGHGEPF